MDRVSRACANYHLKISTKNDWVCSIPACTWHVFKSLIDSPTLEALCPEQCRQMMRLLPKLLNPAQRLADYVEMSGNEVESGLTQSRKSTKLWYCQPTDLDSGHAKRHDHFHLSCLRKFLQIRWQDNIPHTEVLTRAGMKSVYTLLKLAQLRLTGHADKRLPTYVFYGELQVERHS